MAAIIGIKSVGGTLREFYDKPYQVSTSTLLMRGAIQGVGRDLLCVASGIDGAESQTYLDEAKKCQLREEIAARHEISKRSLYWYKAKYREEAFDGLCPMKHEGDFVEVCQDINIVSTLPEYIKPKNVGLMFISMESDKFFPYTQIDVV